MRSATASWNRFRVRPVLTELDRRDMPGSMLDWLLADSLRPDSDTGGGGGSVIDVARSTFLLPPAPPPTLSLTSTAPEAPPGSNPLRSPEPTAALDPTTDELLPAWTGPAFFFTATATSPTAPFDTTPAAETAADYGSPYHLQAPAPADGELAPPPDGQSGNLFFPGGGGGGGIESMSTTPTVSVIAYDYAAAELNMPPGTTTGSFEFTRTGDTSADLVVYYATSGGALTPYDYTGVSGLVAYPHGVPPMCRVVTIPAGQSTEYVTITVVDDPDVEGEEDVTATILPLGTGYSSPPYDPDPAYYTGTIPIADNDFPGPQVFIGRVDATVQEETGNQGQVEIRRANPVGSLSVGYTLTGTATSGVDYTTPGAVNFAPGVDRVWLDFPAINDKFVEGKETIVLTIGTGSGYTPGTPNKAELDLYDNETEYPHSPLPLNYLSDINFGAEDMTVAETGPDPGSFTLDYLYWFEAAGNQPIPDLNYVLGGTAEWGSDYTAELIPLSMISGPPSSRLYQCDDGDFHEIQPTYRVQVPYRIVVTPIDDAEWEGDETIDIAVEQKTSPRPTLNPGVVSITLADNDPAPLPAVVIEAPDEAATELNQWTGSFRFLRNETSLDQELTVSYTIGGTADSSDYKLSGGPGYTGTGSVTFPAGVRFVEVKLTAEDDDEKEGNETALISLQKSPAYTFAEANAKAEVLIIDKAVIDLDVDSNNNNGFDRPELTQAEDDVEDIAGDPTKPGKLTPTNNEDKDSDGVPDFADGYSLALANMPQADKTNASAAIASEKFVQMVVTIPSGKIGLGQASFVLNYSASNPNAVTYDPQTATYTPAVGGLRVWMKAGNVLRNPSSIVDATPGHYVPPGTFNPSQLGLDPNAKTDQEITLYVEGIHVSAAVADQIVSIEMKGVPAALGKQADQVRFTVVDQLLTLQMPGGAFVPLNANNDNGSVVTDEIPATRDFSIVAKTTFADNELQKVTIQKASIPAPLVLEGTYTLTIASAYLLPPGVPPLGRVRVWSDSNKTTEFTSGTTWTHLTVPTSMYVEGMEPTLGLLDLNQQPIADVRLEMKFEWDIAAGVKVLMAKTKQDVTVTPVITRFDTLPGKLVMINPAAGAVGLMATGTAAFPGGPGTQSGADTFAGLFARNMPNIGGVGQINAGQPGPFLIQNGGYAGTDAVVNGDGAALPDGFTLSTGAKANAFLHVGAVAKGANLPVVLDRAGKGLPPGTPPDYLATVAHGGGGIFTIVAMDSPSWAAPVGAGGAAVTYDEAVRDNFRLHLLWRYPADPNGKTTIYPLAKLDWNVFFRGTGNLDFPAAGKPYPAAFFAPTAAAKVTTNPYVVDHTVPGKLVPPDWNDSMVVV